MNKATRDLPNRPSSPCCKNRLKLYSKPLVNYMKILGNISTFNKVYRNNFWYYPPTIFAKNKPP